MIGLLIALTFVAAAEYFKYIKELPPGGQQELAKACHGIGMLALLATGSSSPAALSIS